MPADVGNRVRVFDESGTDRDGFAIIGEEDDRLGNIAFVAGLFVIMDDVFGLELVLGGGANKVNLIGGVIGAVGEVEAGGVGMPMNAGVIA